MTVEKLPYKRSQEAESVIPATQDTEKQNPKINEDLGKLVRWSHNIVKKNLEIQVSEIHWLPSIYEEQGSVPSIDVFVLICFKHNRKIRKVSHKTTEKLCNI